MTAAHRSLVTLARPAGSIVDAVPTVVLCAMRADATASGLEWHGASEPGGGVMGGRQEEAS